MALPVPAALAWSAILRTVVPLVMLVALVAVMPFAPVPAPAATTDDRPRAIRFTGGATQDAAE